MITLDSSAWMHYFMNGPLLEVYAARMPKNPKSIVTPVIILYEVCRNLMRNQVGEELLNVCLSEIEKTHLVDVTKELSYHAADLSLKNKLSMADSIIYATADVFGSKLLTSDSDFKNLPNVEYIPSEE